MAAHGLQLSLLDAAPEPTPRRPGTSARRPAQPRAVETVQPELAFDDAIRAALEHRLRASIGSAVRLTITDNRRTMVSVKRHGGVRVIRLHHMFAQATPEVVSALGRYLLRNDRSASKVIDRFIADNQHRIRRGEPTRATPLVTAGKVYDLAQMARALSERYFGGAVRVDITWGKHAVARRGRRSRRTIRMGTYFIDEKLIRIHPALDQAFVPRYFVEWVVYHEMLHHVIPMPMVNGRRVYHSAEFRRRERLYADYERARAWEEQHLSKLIAARRVLATN